MMYLLSPTIAAEATAVVLLVHGTLHALAPTPTAKKYNVPNDDGFYNITIRSIGCNLLFTSILVLWLTIGEMERYSAYHLVTPIWLVEHLTRVLNKEGSTTSGASDITDMAMLCIVVLLMLGFSGYWGDDSPAYTAKAAIFAFSFFGLGFTFFTKFMYCQIWRLPAELLSPDSKHSAHIYFTGRVFGLTMVQTAVLMAALEFGQMDIVRAFAISCGVLSLTILILPLVSTTAAGIGLTTRHVFMSVACAIASLVMLQDMILPDVEVPLESLSSAQE